jgi:hypothetical protein
VQCVPRLMYVTVVGITQYLYVVTCNSVNELLLQCNMWHKIYTLLLF